MRIYKVQVGEKVITAKRMKVSNLNSHFISLPDAKIYQDDEVFVRCSNKGKPKYYNKQHIVYPVYLPVVEVINYESPFVRFFKRLIPIT